MEIIILAFAIAATGLAAAALAGILAVFAKLE